MKTALAACYGRCIALIATLSLAACGGGGGGSTPSSLSLSSSAPQSGATGVSRAVVPVLVFSASLDAASANTNTVTLASPAGNQAITLSVADKQIKVTPTGTLAPLTSYTLTIGTSLRGSAGERLAAPVTVSFTTAAATAARLWHSPVLIQADTNTDVSEEQIATDANGNALAVWAQGAGLNRKLWSNRYTAGSGWGTPQLIENADGDVAEPHVAFDTNGNALVLWAQVVGGHYNIWANRYTAGSGWGTAQLIQSIGNEEASEPQVAFDAHGNALAVWDEDDGIRINIWATRYTPGSGWDTPRLIETDNAGNALNISLASDPNGNGLAVWQQYDGTRYNIVSNRYTVGSGWGTAQLIETDDAGIAATPNIAMDSSGNALAVWAQSDGTRNNTWSNRYTAGSGWGTPQLIETDNKGNTFQPKIAFDSNGNALAVWQQSDGTRYNMWSNRYTAGNGWGTAQLIETDNAGDATGAQIGFDAQGNALAIWAQSDGTRFHIISNRYTAGTGWGTSEAIEANPGNAFVQPQIAVQANGAALAIWTQFDATATHLNIWSNLYE